MLLLSVSPSSYGFVPSYISLFTNHHYLFLRICTILYLPLYQSSLSLLTDLYHLISPSLPIIIISSYGFVPSSLLISLNLSSHMSRSICIIFFLPYLLLPALAMHTSMSLTLLPRLSPLPDIYVTFCLPILFSPACTTLVSYVFTAQMFPMTIYLSDTRISYSIPQVVLTLPIFLAHTCGIVPSPLAQTTYTA